jgi:hypothetical protein
MAKTLVFRILPIILASPRRRGDKPGTGFFYTSVVMWVGARIARHRWRRLQWWAQIKRPFDGQVAGELGML